MLELLELFLAYFVSRPFTSNVPPSWWNLEFHRSPKKNPAAESMGNLYPLILLNGDFHMANARDQGIATNIFSVTFFCFCACWHHKKSKILLDPKCPWINEGFKIPRKMGWKPPKNEGKVGSHGFCTWFIDVTTFVFNKCLFEKQKSGPQEVAPVAKKSATILFSGL